MSKELSLPKSLKSKVFKTYIADKIASYFSMLEFVKKNKNIVPKLIARYGIEADEIAKDCWIDTWKINDNGGAKEFHRKAYSGQHITTDLENKITRQTTSVVTNYYLKHIKYQYEQDEESGKICSALTLMDDEDMSKITTHFLNQEEQIKELFLNLTLDKCDAIILMWVMEFIEEKEAQKMLGVCRATLFNRWSKLRFRLMTDFYKPVKKSDFKPQNNQHGFYGFLLKNDKESDWITRDLIQESSDPKIKAILRKKKEIQKELDIHNGNWIGEDKTPE